ASPFVYLGHEAICAVAEKHGVKLHPKPVHLPRVWANSGSVPLGERTPLRQRYRLLEIERLAHWRGLRVNPKPAHFPVDPTLADKCVIALIDMGANPLAFMGDVFAAVWANERNISDETFLKELLASHGHDAEAVLAAANSDAVEATRQSNTVEAIAADAAGVPSYVVDGEVFWGQDRIEHIDHMLTSGRAPIRGSTDG
ncbi:MAG: 2-hydroxychromene-2-carboxylate isomerase, partial [Pseudomonadota bacterium]